MVFRCFYCIWGYCLIYFYFVGVGILLIFYVVVKGGWLSFVFFLVFVLICCYIVILFCCCLDLDLYIYSYLDVGEVLFGKWGWWIIFIMLYLEFYVVVIEFLILEGDNLVYFFLFVGILFGCIILCFNEIFIIMFVVCMLLIVWFWELSVLFYIFVIGVVVFFLIVLIVGWIGIFDGVGFYN